MVGSYNPTESLLGASPSVMSPSSRIGDGEFSEESSPGWFRRSSSAKFASSFSGGFDLTSVKSSDALQFQEKKPVTETQDERGPSSKPTKAERRAMQDAQRDAKAAAEGFVFFSFSY